MFKHFIWDFDGTLFDAYPVMTDAMMKVLDRYAITENREQIYSKMKHSMGYMLNYIEETYHPMEELYKTFHTERSQIEKEGLKPFPGISEICNFIVNNKGDNHLFTHRGLSAVYFLKKYQLYNLFMGLVTSENGFDRKPSPMGIDYLMDTYGLDPSKTLMIGDRDIDLMSAKNAGIKTCFFQQDGEAAPMSADYIINDFKQLEDFMDTNIEKT